MNYSATYKNGGTSISRISAWYFGAIVAAATIRLLNLDEAALWFDEVMTAEWVSLSWSDLLQVSLSDNHLPLYFFVLKAWTGVTGIDSWSLRLPSVFFSIVTVVLTAKIAYWLVGRQCAYWAAWFAAFSPFLLHHAQEARMYSLMSVLSAAAILLLVRFLFNQTSKLGPAFVLVNFALLATHYYSIFFVAGELAVLFFSIRRPRRSWIPAAVAIGLGMMTIVVAAQIFPQPNAGEIYDTGILVLPGVLWSLVTGYILIPSSFELHALGAKAVLPYLPAALLAAFPIGVCLIFGLRSLPVTARAIVLFPVVFGMAGPFIVYLTFSSIAINPRYFAAVVPLVLVLLAAGAGTGDIRALRTRLGLIVLVVMALAAVAHVAKPGHGREDMQAAGAWLDAHVAADEQILVTSEEMAYLARHHWPQHRLRLYPDRTERQLDSDTLAERLPFDGQPRVYYVFGRAWLTDPDGSLRKLLRSRYRECPGAELRGVQIVCIAHP